MCSVTGGVSYRIAINDNTAAVVGDRPYSKVKIALAVLPVLVLTASPSSCAAGAG